MSQAVLYVCRFGYCRAENGQEKKLFFTSKSPCWWQFRFGKPFNVEHQQQQILSTKFPESSALGRQHTTGPIWRLICPVSLVTAPGSKTIFKEKSPK